MKLSKSDFMGKVNEKLEGTGLTKKQVDAVTNAVFGTLSDVMASGDKVSIPQFGTFGTSARTARKGKNPSTGESIDIPASTAPKFTAAPSLKAAVNK